MTPTFTSHHLASLETSRLRDVDALRGFALLGILVVNIAYFASGYPFHQVSDPAFSSVVDHSVHWLVTAFVEMKFYLLFSFLFGYSFTLQLDSAERSGARFRPRFLRRLAVLFVIGGLHAILLFQGDILTTYAVLGLILLVVHRIQPRTALIVAATLTALVALFFGAISLGDAPIVNEAQALEQGQQSTIALSGGITSLITEHLAAIPHMLVALVVQQGPIAFAAFLAGLAAGKLRALSDTARQNRALRTIQLVGFPIGLAGGVVFASLGGTSSAAGLSISVATAPFLAAAYAATLLRLCHTAWGTTIAELLAPAGRMALSNYLGQSLICVVLFTGVGFGLVGTVPPLAVLGIAIAIFAAQLVASAGWMRTHRYGPVEWLLRAATNVETPPWRARP
ncbi:DUF418 domain-containing protein [Haloechinothrix salitolerans]|uniref:DUF418 domain-containing protein n=1 Tax=Haloechinothrix salitolerans TaxID=926830 RepID=A0ABW2C155_9PSEU